MKRSYTTTFGMILVTYLVLHTTNKLLRIENYITLVMLAFP